MSTRPSFTGYIEDVPLVNSVNLVFTHMPGGVARAVQVFVVVSHSAEGSYFLLLVDSSYIESCNSFVLLFCSTYDIFQQWMITS